ncbi:MAG: protease SohB [Proteobacteria bacterium]|nr:protease SohB [Pseudomonadota bacterium]
MAYLFDYLIFLAQVATIVVAILIIISAIASLSMKRTTAQVGHLEVNKLNDRLDDLKHSIEHAVLPGAAFKKQMKQENKRHKKEQKQASKELKSGEPDVETKHPRLYVIDFEGDVAATAVSQLRTEITAVLTMACDADEVLIRLESPGGMVHSYGLAASQLHRVRQQGIRLVVAVDKVAASGGYLMAAVADRVLAAPFALVGSIGVVAQIPNVHRLLKKNDVDVEILTAGAHKRTLTVFGENTEDGRAKFIEELEDVHALFQEFVGEHRPDLDLSLVATGEAWYGKRALDLKLVDEITTSDSYLVKACQEKEVFKVSWVDRKSPFERLMGQVEGVMTRIQDMIPVWGSRGI